MPSFLFLSSSFPWIYKLASALMTQGYFTREILFFDLKNWVKNKKNLEHIYNNNSYKYIFPPGYAGSLQYLWNPLISRILHSHVDYIKYKTSCYPYIVVPYPYLYPWISRFPDEKIIYINYDDYGFYNPNRAEKTYALEKLLIKKSKIVLCASNNQFKRFVSENKVASNKIFHFPHGCSLLPQSNQSLHYEPLSVGYIGNLTSRVNWKLAYDVARLLPEFKFNYAGHLDSKQIDEVQENFRSLTLNLSNVFYCGYINQEKIYEFYSMHLVNWMPYSLEDSFNLASSPTKIMDALASGRPFISSKLPECLLYPNLIQTFSNSLEAATLIKNFSSSLFCHDYFGQLEFAFNNTWDIRAQQLLTYLQE